MVEVVPPVVQPEENWLNQNPPEVQQQPEGNWLNQNPPVKQNPLFKPKTMNEPQQSDIYEYRKYKELQKQNQVGLELSQMKLNQNTYNVKDPLQDQALQQRLSQLTSTMGPWNHTVPIQNSFQKENQFNTFKPQTLDEENQQDSTPSFLRRSKMMLGNSQIVGRVLPDRMPQFDWSTNPQVVHKPRNHFFLILCLN
jgi:hypothetical protein